MKLTVIILLVALAGCKHFETPRAKKPQFPGHREVACTTRQPPTCAEVNDLSEPIF